MLVDYKSFRNTFKIFLRHFIFSSFLLQFPWLVALYCNRDHFYETPFQPIRFQTNEILAYLQIIEKAKKLFVVGKGFLI
jgi:hypothetical protein